MMAPRIKTDEEHAQILLKIDDSTSIEKARRVIEDLGVTILKTEPLSQPGSDRYVVFILGIKDMREVALGLIESGIRSIEGYNASSLKL